MEQQTEPVAATAGEDRAKAIAADIMERAYEHDRIPIGALARGHDGDELVAEILHELHRLGWVAQAGTDPQRGPCYRLGPAAPESIEAAREQIANDDASPRQDTTRLPLGVRARAALEQTLTRLEREGIGGGGEIAGAVAQLAQGTLALEALDRGQMPPAAILERAARLLSRCAVMLGNVQERHGRLMPADVDGDDLNGFEPTMPLGAHRVIPDGFEDLDPQDLAAAARALRPSA